jgi:hypothetical protein
MTTTLPTAIRHLNQHDLAARWGVSVRTLERWRWLNQGPAFLKIGGRVAYRLEDIKAYEVARRHVPGPVRDPFFQGRR